MQTWQRHTSTVVTITMLIVLVLVSSSLVVGVESLECSEGIVRKPLRFGKRSPFLSWLTRMPRMEKHPCIAKFEQRRSEGDLTTRMTSNKLKAQYWQNALRQQQQQQKSDVDQQGHVFIEVIRY